MIDFDPVSKASKYLLIIGAVAGLALHGSGEPLQAQSGGRPIPDELRRPMLPPGVAGQWAGILGKAVPGYFQPVRVDLPSMGQVTFYQGSRENPATLQAPAQVGLEVGHTYRLKISHMPEFPGIELYPSVELLDRLHPPPHLKEQFPVPVELTAEEIQQALEGRLVTKVIYLEQPRHAAPRELTKPMQVGLVRPQENVLAVAETLGRPMAIFRLGGRLPSPQGFDATFFGSGAPVVVPSSHPAHAENGVSPQPFAAR